MASNVFELVSEKDWRWRYNTKTNTWDIVCMVGEYIADKGQVVYKLLAYQGNTNWSTHIDLIYDGYENSGFYELDENYYAYYYDDALNGWSDNSTNGAFRTAY